MQWPTTPSEYLFSWKPYEFAKIQLQPDGKKKYLCRSQVLQSVQCLRSTCLVKMNLVVLHPSKPTDFNGLSRVGLLLKLHFDIPAAPGVYWKSFMLAQTCMLFHIWSELVAYWNPSKRIKLPFISRGPGVYLFGRIHKSVTSNCKVKTDVCRYEVWAGEEFGRRHCQGIVQHKSSKFVSGQ